MRKLSALLCVVAILSLPQAVQAQSMENSLYKIQMGNLNSIAGEVSDSNYNISITSGETSPGLYEGNNFKVKAGFQYVPRSTPFSFAISNTLIDFGVLSPTNPITRTTVLTVNNTEAKGFKVTAAENHELMVAKTGAKIPDTTCDDGKCSETQSSAWTNTLTYGFGYRCDGQDNKPCVPNDRSFTNKNNYKHFADTSRKETATTIMSGGTGTGLKATITYKVNISSSQPAGAYTNAVTYLATPTY
jgi:hypothetical protein